MVCESYDVTWMTLEGDCRKGCMWVTALCLSSLESRWTKSTTGALIEGLGRTHSIKRHAGDACPSPAGEGATVFFSLMHPRTSNCLSLRTERIQGERIWLFSFQARERLVPFLFSSIHYQVIPNNFILQIQEQTKKINDHGVGVSETHWVDFHFTSKQNFWFSRKQALKDRIIFFWRMRREVRGPWFLHFLGGRPLNNQVEVMSCSAYTVLVF